MSTATDREGTAGHTPSSPKKLTPTEWLAAFKRSFAGFISDDCMGLAQQIAYSSLLAFFPAMAFLVGALGLFHLFDDVKQLLDPIAPNGVIRFITSLQQDSQGGTSVAAFLIGLFGAVWAASGAMTSVIKAVNNAYRASLGGVFQWVWGAARWPVAFCAILLFFGLVYYLAPNKEQRSWKWITPGSLVGGLLWLLLSSLFALYVTFAGNYSKTYGTIASGVILLLWLNYSAFALLFGAELNAEPDRQADIRAAGGERAGPVKLSRRGA